MTLAFQVETVDQVVHVCTICQRSNSVVEIVNMRRIGVVGPGLMGLGIAQIAAAAGYDVVLMGRDAAASELGLSRLESQLGRHVERRRLTEEASRAILGKVEAAAGPASLTGCDIGIESVHEDRALKAAVLDMMQNALGPGRLIATNTSGLPIGGLAENLREPDRFIGLHFFSPVERMKLVEVVPGRSTSDATLEEALAFVRSLGQSPVKVSDGPGFFTSRVFCAYLDEALAMVGEGVEAELIEAAALAGGRAVGPLAVLDDTSLNLSLQHSRQAVADGLPEARCRLIGVHVLESMIEIGRSGRREGGAFYEHTDGDRRLWPGLASLFPRDGRRPAAADVQDRLRFAEAMEALRALEEGAIGSADDADTASVQGLGFPGKGVFAWVEDYGLPAFVDRSTALARQHGARFEPSSWLRARAQSGDGLQPWREHSHLAARGSAGHS